jgi:acetyl esterase/lipase
VRCHAEKHGGDPNFIVAGGESAGGHLAALLALTPHVPEFFPPTGFDFGASGGGEAGGPGGASAAAATALSVQGVLSIAGALDFTDVSGALRGYAGARELFKTYLELFLVRGSFEHSLHSFVRASPVCWVLGARLPHALLAASPPLRLPRPAEVFPEALLGGAPPTQSRSDAAAGDRFATSWAPIIAVCGGSALLGAPPPPPHDNLLLAAGAAPESGRAAAAASAGAGAEGAGEGTGAADPFDFVRDMLSEGAPIPPFVLVHGDADTMVPCAVTEHFYRVLQARRARDKTAGAAAVKDVFLKVAGAHHVANFLFSSRTLATGDAIADALADMHQRRALSIR